MNTGIKKLKELGVGNAIIESCIERGKIQAAVSNATQFLKYYRYAIKSNIMTREQAITGLLPYYNALKDVEQLANYYSQLWLEKYSKIKLQIEKTIN